MANVNPIVTVFGEVRSKNERTLIDPDTGEVKHKLTVSVLTRQGFIDVSIPASLRPFDRSEGDFVVLEVAVLSWAYKGRTGTSFVLDVDDTPDGMQAPLERAGAKK